MSRSRIFLLAALGVTIALLAAIFGAGPARASLTAAPCDAFRAGPVTWVKLTGEGQIDQRVEAYPGGTRQITPIFSYTCLPKYITIVTIFSLNGTTIFTDREVLNPSANMGAYSYSMSKPDNTPLDQGEWRVSFYKDKMLLTSGTVLVSGDQPSQTVAVEGTVRDGNSRKPIAGAVVAVLRPGITVTAYLASGKDTDVFASGTTDDRGHFLLNQSLARNTGYAWLIIAKGYKPLTQDGLTVGDTEPSKVTVDIRLVK